MTHLNGLHVVPIVCGRMKDVDGFDGRLALLLAAKDQIDPVGNIFANKVRLQSLAVDLDEETRVVA